MLHRYIQLINKALEKLPFFNYTVRLINYIKKPNLDTSPNTVEQLEHSLLDVINALGLVIVLSVFFVLYDDGYSHFKAYKTFNPLFIVVSYIYYGLFFSFFMAIGVLIISTFPIHKMDHTRSSIFYTIFCHCLRFYAAFGLLLGILIVHAIGTLLTTGNTIQSAFEHWFFYIYIFVTIIWFPFRLLINPIVRILNPVSHTWFTLILVVITAVVTATSNQYLPNTLSQKILDNKELCTVVKSGDFYMESARNKKIEIEKYLCKQKGK